VSISSTFYEQLLRQYSCAKKLQSQTVTREKLHKILSFKEAARKMLVKLTPARSVSLRELMPCKIMVMINHS